MREGRQAEVQDNCGSGLNRWAPATGAGGTREATLDTGELETEGREMAPAGPGASIMTCGFRGCSMWARVPR